MKNIYIILICTVCILKLNGQERVTLIQSNYNCNMLEGVNCMQKEQYNEAIIYFQNASNLCPYYHKPYYQLVLCFDLIGDTIQTFINFEKLILTGTKSSSITKNNISNFIKTKLYSELLKKEDSLYNTSYSNYNQSFINDIQKLIILKKQRFVLNQLDTLILDSLISICNKYRRFPSAINCPSDIYRGVINSIIKNSLFGYNPDSKRWEDIKNLIIEESSKGGIESEYVATIIDIDLYYKSLETKYGVLEEITFPGIKNPKAEEIIINRREIGLCENL